MKNDADIPLGDYTDNVRKIIGRRIDDFGTSYSHISSFLCDPRFTEKELETALRILKEKNKGKLKQKAIEVELEARRQLETETPLTEKLKQEWRDMQKAAKRRKKQREQMDTSNRETTRKGWIIHSDI